MSTKNNICRRCPNTIKVLVAGICTKRKSRDLSQYDLSESTGLSRNCIQQMECYEHLPKLDTIFEIMLVLDFDEEESKDFLWDCLNAYRKDKGLQEEREKKLAGVI